MYEPNEEQTSFIIDRGLYYYKAMPFSLKIAGATYQRHVNGMFEDLIRKLMEVYVDDMLVKSKTAGGHIEHLNQIFNILQKYQMKLNPLKCAFEVRSGKLLGFMISQCRIEANSKKINVLLEMSSPRKPKEVMTLADRVAVLSRFVSRATDRCAPFFVVLKGYKKFKWTDKCEQAFLALKEHLGRPPLLSKLIEGEKLYLYLVVSNSRFSQGRRESKMANQLRKQKALGCRDQVSQVGETSSSPHGRIQKTEAILSCTFNRGLNQLPTMPSATKARSLRQAPQVGNRVGAVRCELSPPNDDKGLSLSRLYSRVHLLRCC